MAYFIEPDTIEEILERADIVDVVGQYVELKQVGTNYRGLCPFHLEKTPSFTVSPQKKIYKCFGCGEGGSVINFLMKMEGLSFPEACSKLADMYGVEISSSNDYQKQIRENNSLLYEINRQTALYYMECLKNNKRARRYLEDRNIDEKLIKRFGLGYSGDSWEDTVEFLKSKNYDLEKGIEAGLIKKSDKGHYYDFFKNRIMFPIIDTKSRVIGFGGRVINDDKPKYLNTGETKIYHKGNELYGLNILKKNIKIPRIFLVEGYMDVIGLASAGIYGAVASLGTAFTIQQAKLIEKYTSNLYIIYDGDEAGRKASKAAVEIFHKIDYEPKVVQLPGGLDPEEYLKKYGKFQFQVKMEEALEGYSFLIEEKSKELNLNTVDGMAELIRYIGNTTKSIKSPIERELQIQKISKTFNISLDTLKREIYGKEKKESNTVNAKENITSKKYTSNDKAIIDILKIILKDKENYFYLKDKIDSEKITNKNLKEIYLALSNTIESGNKLHREEFLNYFRKNYIIDNELFNYLIKDNEEFEEIDSISLMDDLVDRIENIDKKLESNEILNRIQELEGKSEKSQEDIKEINDLLNRLMDVNK